MQTIVIVEIVCAVFLGVILICQSGERNVTKSSRLLRLCMVMELLALAVDCMAYAFMGPETPFAFRYAVCLLAYSAGGIMELGFAHYSEAYFSEKTEVSPWVFSVLKAASVLWILVTAGEFIAGRMVIFESGVEVADNGFPLYLAIYQIAVMLYTPVVAFLYRKKLGREAFVLLSVFNIAPVFGIFSAIVAYFDYSYVLGAVILVYISESIQKRRVREQQKAIEQHEGIAQNARRIFALEDDFESLYDVELESGHYTSYDRDAFYRTTISDKLVSPTEFFEDLRTNIERVVYEDDREDLYNVQNREAIRRELAENDHFDHYYRIITDNGPMWLKMRLVYKDAEKKNVIVGVFNAEEEMAARQAEERVREELARTNARLFALEDDFESLYDVELASGHYDVFVKGDFFRNNVLDKLSVPKDYFAELNENIDAVIYEEDREGLYRALTRESIVSELASSEHFDWYYRIITENGPA